MPDDPRRLRPGVVFVLALAAGIGIANNYTTQPLLPEIARSLHSGIGTVGLVVASAQLGYTLGLVFLAPMADRFNRKKLILLQCVGLALALLLAAVSANLLMLLIASVLSGALATIAVQANAFAAQLAPVASRGQVVGTIAIGVSLGILLGRAAGGTIGQQLGWRTMLALSAVLVLLLAGLAAWRLPNISATARLSYGQLLSSLWPLLRRESVLREGAAVGALWFAAFSAFWATLAAHVARAPFDYGPQAAGALGLLGITGAVSSRISGTLTDRLGARPVIVAALVLVLCSFIVMWVRGSTLWGLVLGIILLDVGAFSAQVANQTRVFALVPEARSRVYSVYMFLYYAGGAAGSALGPWVFERLGWGGLCALGVGFSGTAIAILGCDRS